MDETPTPQTDVVNEETGSTKCPYCAMTCWLIGQRFGGIRDCPNCKGTGRVASGESELPRE